MGKKGTDTKDTNRIVHNSELDKFLSDHLFTKDGILEIDDTNSESIQESVQKEKQEGFLDESIEENTFNLPEEVDIDFTMSIDDTTILDKENTEINNFDDLTFDLPEEIETDIEKIKEFQQENLLEDSSEKETIDAPKEAVSEQKSKKNKKPEEKESGSKKKWFLLAFMIVFLLFCITILPSFLMQENTKNTTTEEIITVEEPEEVPLLEEQIVEWKPFWIDKSTDNNTTFFTIKFTTRTRSSGVLEESREKEHLIRDAIYFYLQKVNTDDLDKNTSEHLGKIKKDILNIINSFLTTGTFPEIGVENILVQ
ncbi:MAG: flagellar basal body-associated FliL family protein [Desulfovibrionaceae bacterium]